jgi:hypothetical protein
MPAFPAIEPKTRAYDLGGDFPVTSEEAWPSGSVRYATGRTVYNAAGMRLTLTYKDITADEAQLLRAHYHNQQGGMIPFMLPAVIWKGHASDLLPSSTRWRYAEPPSEESKKAGQASMTIVLQSMDYVAA